MTVASKTWYDHVQDLKANGYTYAGLENDYGFKRPESDDWTKSYYSSLSCMTVYTSEKLKMYTVLDTGD